MNTYIFHWRDGKDETLIGDTAADALNRAGYGRGAVAALDYYEQALPECPTYY
jgi:hypothetical protein